MLLFDHRVYSKKLLTNEKFICRYCDGGELFDRIQLYEHFSEKMAAELMKQILQAVVYCHSQSIVHRFILKSSIGNYSILKKKL